jgi:hypothetical protein
MAAFSRAAVRGLSLSHPGIGLGFGQNVAGAFWNLVAAIGCLIGAVICFVALILSPPTFINFLAAVGPELEHWVALRGS